MIGKRKRIKRYRAWCDQIRAAAYDDARMLAVTVVGRWNLADVPTYDLGIVVRAGEVIWQRAPAAYWWRGEQRWLEQHVSRAGYRSTLTETHRTVLNCSGTLEWLISDQRLAAREPNGEVISIDWAAIHGVSIDLANDVVAFDGADGYHGELRGPAIAPIAVAAIARCYGPCALLDHPALTPLRTISSPASGDGHGFVAEPEPDGTNLAKRESCHTA